MLFVHMREIAARSCVCVMHPVGGRVRRLLDRVCRGGRRGLWCGGAVRRSGLGLQAEESLSLPLPH